jgi:hypothetical protein
MVQERIKCGLKDNVDIFELVPDGFVWIFLIILIIIALKVSSGDDDKRR